MDLQGLLRCGAGIYAGLRHDLQVEKLALQVEKLAPVVADLSFAMGKHYHNCSCEVMDEGDFCVVWFQDINKETIVLLQWNAKDPGWH